MKVDPGRTYMYNTSQQSKKSRFWKKLRDIRRYCMKKKLLKMICAVLCIVLLTGMMGTAAAAKKKSGGSIEASGIEEALADWYYVVDTVPEGLLNQKEEPLFLYSSSGQGSESEQPTICSADFQSGDAALKDAIQFRIENTGTHIWVDNNCLKSPGEATFKLHLESDSYIFEKKYTLRVLDYNEYPMFEVINEHAVIEADLEDNWYDKTLIEMVMKVNAEDIRTKLKIKPWNYRSWYIKPYLYDIELPKEAEERNALTHDYVPYPFERIFKTTLHDFGAYEVQAGYAEGNVKLSLPVRISALGLTVNASGEASPGKTVKMSVNGSTEGKKFTWSVEDDGAKIDEKTGDLTIDKNAEMGTGFKVTARTAEGDEISCMVYVNDGVLKGMDFGQASGEGFTVGHPVGDGWYSDDFSTQYNGYLIRDEYHGERGYLVVDGRFYIMDDVIAGGYAEDPEKAREMLGTIGAENNKETRDVETEIFEIDGHPALLESYSNFNKDGSFNSHAGRMMYPRNNRLFILRVFSVPDEGKGDTETLKVTMTDLKVLASKVTYNENKAPLTAKNAEITVTAKGDPVGITAGKTQQFAVEFADKDQINKKAKNDGVVWSVVNAETGEATTAATITDRGQLKIDKALDAIVPLEVKAVSVIYGTEGIYRLDAMPVISTVTIEPAELFFYAGTDTAKMVKVTLDPPIEAKGISWTPNKEGIVEINDNGDGTVSIKPLAAGKINVDVKEPGGKKAKLTVNVVDPVTALTLTAKGAVKPGGSVTVSTTTEPKNPGNKTLEWSLNVGEDIAVINDRGQIKISKEAPLGTKFTVTCKALGAPEPVVATLDLEVAGK